MRVRFKKINNKKIKMNQAPNIANIEQYHQHFNGQAGYVKHQPRTERGCNDKCCYGMFIFFTLLLVGGGIFFICSANFKELENASSNSTSTNSTKMSPEESYHIQNLRPGLPVIVGMIVLSGVLSVVFLLLLVKFPTCMFYTMLAVGAILFIGLAVLLFVMGEVAGGIVIVVLLLIYAAFLYCSRDKIRVGIVLLQTASEFVMEKPSVFIAPFILSFIIIAFEVFWLVSLVAISLYTGNAKTEQQLEKSQSVAGAFALIWLFLQFFYSFFFYYCIVFLIATAAAFWYYNVDGNYLCVGAKRIMANHLGSFTFAAIIVALIAMAKSSTDNAARRSQGAGAVCLTILGCLLSAIEDLVQTLNHNAIITMAVTGESYIDSAKSTISLIFDNFWLFLIIDMVSTMLKLTGIIFICAIPGIVGYLLLQATAQNPNDSTFLSLGTVIIVLASMLIASIFLSVLSEALSCVFIFYCLDKRFMQIGYPTPQNVPPPMRKLFQQLNQTPASTNPYSNPYQSAADYPRASGYPSVYH